LIRPSSFACSSGNLRTWHVSRAGGSNGRSKQAERVLVCDLVIAEAYFALQHHYGIPKARVRALLRQFVESGVVETDPATLSSDLQPALGAGLVDRFVHSRYRALGANTLTFERKQAALEGAVRLWT
jgi:hypothetical protein